MRARNLKAGFFKNEELAALNPLARILFEGLWCFSDREGKFEWRPKRIKAEILPYDRCDIEKLLMSLHAMTFIYRYQIDGQEYGIVPKFLDHQSPHPHEAISKIPNPPEDILKEIQCHGMSITLPEMSVTSPADIRNPDIRNPDIRNPSSNGMFDIFWKEYPKKKSRGEAQKVWNKLKPDEALLKRMLSSIEKAKGSVDWQKDNGQFIPFPATWLNGKRWEDDEVVLEDNKKPELAKVQCRFCREVFFVKDEHECKEIDVEQLKGLA